MQRTKIEWCDLTWSPVTGCLHNCEYCYAEKIAKRFGGHWNQNTGENIRIANGKLHDLGMPKLFEQKNGKLCAASYPYDFDPTFRRYLLDEPTKIKQPQNIFVCSMADLFGNWIPDEWIEAVFEACKKAPQHRYLFLTKNPDRYNPLQSVPENFWLGQTITNNSEERMLCWGDVNTFISVEPIQEPVRVVVGFYDWIIIGAETGNRKGRVIPKREWIQYIVDSAKSANKPVFMKGSLTKIWGEPLIQEFPWKKEDDNA